MASISAPRVGRGFRGLLGYVWRAMSCELPAVSIVIPVHNAEDYVGDTLASVLNQTWRDLEVIVVNDGSTDRSVDVCRRFNDARVRYVEQENGGLAAARNAGIAAARGDFVGFIDADDEWLPQKVARHLDHFRSDGTLGLSYSYSRLMDEAGHDIGILQKEGRTPTRFADAYVQNVIGNGSNAILRKEVFDGRASDPGSFPPMVSFDPELRRAEDFELWARITGSTQWKVACIPEVLVRYRMNSTGLSSNTRLQRHYHLLALAKIGAALPHAAEQHRRKAVAHMYWHQARIMAHRMESRGGARAVRLAIHYDWRSLNGNHFMIGVALLASLLLNRAAYFRLLDAASRIWGRWQRVQIRLLVGRTNALPAPDREGRDMARFIGEPESYARSKAMPSLFFVCHRHKLTFLGVSKNASSSLKYVMYREEYGDPGEADVHALWGWRAKTGRAIALGDAKGLSAYPEYTRFAVYRDPISRFLSAYHNRVLYAPDPHPYFAGHRLEGMALDHFIDVATSMLKMANRLHIDEHLRPQAWFYRPEDVHYVVPLESLSSFLRDRFGIEFGPSQNATSLPRITPTPEQCTRIRQLYECDYAIRPNWPHPAGPDDGNQPRLPRPGTGGPALWARMGS